MKHYDPDPQCVKCRTPRPTTEYHGPNTEFCMLSGQEHLHRRCTNCGYEWAEEPADAGTG